MRLISSVFEIRLNSLADLAPDRATDFFRVLLWNEAERVGIGRNLLQFSGNINVSDGGIDAVIRNAKPSSDEVIPQGLSGYQVKTSPLSPADCRKELHQNERLSDPLKPEIKKLLDAGGTYVLALFSDEVHPKKVLIEQAIGEDLTTVGYQNPKFRVYTVDQIASFATRFLAQVASLNEYLLQGLPYQMWAQNRDVIAPRSFVTDTNRDKIIEDIRDTVRKQGEETPVFRLTGLSGLGKTRLVFEALSPDDLKNSVLYGRGESFTNPSVLNNIVMDQNLHVVIVADECTLSDHELLVRNLASRGSRISVISISQEIERHAPPTRLFRIDPLSNDCIEKLLQNEIKGLPNNVISRLATFADGYPRLALLLAQNYRLSSGTADDILTVNDAALINRLIAGNLATSSEKFNKTKRVLMGLAVFQKVGYKGDLSSESQWVAQLMDVRWTDFQEIVSEQQQRGILQGEYYLYVTPYLLSIHLVREWWETYGRHKDFDKFIEEIPGQMRGRFLQWIPFATSTDPGQKLVKQLLSPSGVFADPATLKSQGGGQLFSRLAEADPASALQTLKMTIGTWTKDDLQQFTTGRRAIVSALEGIAMWRELFPDAARLLLALGEAENEPYANNASGLFADLFSPGWGELAHTEASPEERFPILVEALDSQTIERKRLALRAFKAALRSRSFMRMVGAEYQGARPIPKLWTPKDYTPIIEYYRNVWVYLKDSLGKLDSEIRNEAAEVLLDSARDIVRVSPGLSDLVLQTIDSMLQLEWIDKRELIKTVSEILHYETKSMTPNLLDRWSLLSDRLAGKDFSDQLKRYVGMDLLEDYFADGHSYDDKSIKLKIQGLAKTAMQDPKRLEPEYVWLTASHAQRGRQFGYELGKVDSESHLLQRLLDAQEKAGPQSNVSFLGGYLCAVFEKDQALWNKTLQSLSENDQLKQFLPMLTWMSGVTDESIRRVLHMVKNGDVDLETLNLLRFGSVVKNLSEPVLKSCVEVLLSDPKDTGAITALDVFYSYYVYGKEKRSLDKNLALNILLHQIFWSNPNHVTIDTMAEYVWKETALRFVAQFPDVGPLLAERMVSYFGHEGSIIEGYHSDAEDVLTEIVKTGPQLVWKTIEMYLGPPIDKRAFSLTRWLRGDERKPAALQLFAPGLIWQWIDTDVEKRARHLAFFVPPTLSFQGEQSSLAREFLAKYGDRKDVRDAFTANYSTEGWTGSETLHYKMRRDELLEFRKHETNQNVIKWIDEYLSILAVRIEQAGAREELEGL